VAISAGGYGSLIAYFGADTLLRVARRPLPLVTQRQMQMQDASTAGAGASGSGGAGGSGSDSVAVSEEVRLALLRGGDDGAGDGNQGGIKDDYSSLLLGSKGNSNGGECAFTGAPRAVSSMFWARDGTALFCASGASILVWRTAEHVAQVGVTADHCYLLSAVTTAICYLLSAADCFRDAFYSCPTKKIKVAVIVIHFTRHK
jgi:hypothetical protein